MAITKQNLVESVAQKTKRPQAMVREVIEQLLSTTVECASMIGPVEIRNFGTFYWKERKPRPARNPKTGEICSIPRRNVFLARFSPEIRNYIKPEADDAIPVNNPAPAQPTTPTAAKLELGGAVLHSPPAPLPIQPEIQKAKPGPAIEPRKAGTFLHRVSGHPSNARKPSAKILTREQEQGYSGKLGGNR